MRRWERLYRLLHDWQISLTITIATRGPDDVPAIGGGAMPTVVPLDPPEDDATFGFRSSRAPAG